MDILTQEFLKELLNYDPETGIFTWLVDRHSFKSKGKIAGNIDARGYIGIKVANKRKYGHRLAWFYVHGVWPEEMDHINHIKTDNRIINLRTVSHKENCRNRTLGKNNKSGFIGVSWDNRSGQWASQISVNGKDKHLGYFNDIKDAVAARGEANCEHEFHPNHGITY